MLSFRRRRGPVISRLTEQQPLILSGHGEGRGRKLDYKISLHLTLLSKLLILCLSFKEMMVEFSSSSYNSCLFTACRPLVNYVNHFQTRRQRNGVHRSTVIITTISTAASVNRLRCPPPPFLRHPMATRVVGQLSAAGGHRVLRKRKFRLLATQLHTL